MNQFLFENQALSGHLPDTLANSNNARYSVPVTEKEVTGFGSPKTQGEQAAMRLFFCSCTPLRAFNGGLGGGALGLAGGLVCRSSNPAQFRRPHLKVRGGLTATQGGRNA